MLIHDRESLLKYTVGIPRVFFPGFFGLQPSPRADRAFRRGDGVSLIAFRESFPGKLYMFYVESSQENFRNSTLAVWAHIETSGKCYLMCFLNYDRSQNQSWSRSRSRSWRLQSAFSTSATAGASGVGRPSPPVRSFAARIAWDRTKPRPRRMS